VVVTPDVDGLHTAGEVGADGARDDRVPHGLGRPHAQEVLVSEHERPQVQAHLARAVGHPALVGDDHVPYGGHEVLLGQRRQPQSFCAPDEAPRVHLGTEQPDGAVGVPVRLEAFEDLLRIVEDGTRRVE